MAKERKTSLSVSDIVEIIRAVDATSLSQVNIEAGDVWLKIQGRRVRSNPTLPDDVPTVDPVASKTPRERDAGTMEQTTAITGASDSLLVDTTRSNGRSGAFELRAPVSGKVRRRTDADGKHWVGLGNLIEVGDALCVLENADGLISLHSEVDGTVVDICIDDIQEVEAGQLLFRAEPA